MERNISICIPTYERVDMLFEAFEKVYVDDRISEIIIVDDASSPDVFEKIRKRCFELSKVVLYRNANNRDCYENKYTALSYASNDWCILLDSDNIILPDYINAIFEREWSDEIAYLPVFAKPHFDYRKFSGLLVSRENVSGFMDIDMFSTALNTANYFINRKNYLKAWTKDVNPVTADSIFMNYRWLDAGLKLFFVPGLEYEHRVHPGSHYQNNVSRTPAGFLADIENKLKQMK